MKAAAFAAALLLAGCDKPWPYGVEPPPAAYAHLEPGVPVILVPVPLGEVNSACHSFAGDSTGLRVDGCALLGKVACLVVIPIADPARGYPQPHIDAIFAHEKFGHCNKLIHPKDGRGWKLAA
jgi:hypothetical protein